MNYKHFFGKGRYTHGSDCTTVFHEEKEMELSEPTKIESILHAETLLLSYKKEAHLAHIELILHEPHWATLGLDTIYSKLRFPDPIDGMLKTKAVIGWKKKKMQKLVPLNLRRMVFKLNGKVQFKNLILMIILTLQQ